MKLTVIEQVQIQDFKLGVGALKEIASRGGRRIMELCRQCGMF
jgi:hypothetical protein